MPALTQHAHMQCCIGSGTSCDAGVDASICLQPLSQTAHANQLLRRGGVSRNHRGLTDSLSVPIALLFRRSLYAPPQAAPAALQLVSHVTIDVCRVELHKTSSVLYRDTRVRHLRRRQGKKGSFKGPTHHQGATNFEFSDVSTAFPAPELQLHISGLLRDTASFIRCNWIHLLFSRTR